LQLLRRKIKSQTIFPNRVNIHEISSLFENPDWHPRRYNHGSLRSLQRFFTLAI
jgi:hypothetical protein